MADHIWFVSFFVCMANAQHFEKISVNQTICMTNRKGSAYEVCIYSKMRWENNKRGKGNRKTNVWKNRENEKNEKRSHHYTWICNWIKNEQIWGKKCSTDSKSTNVMWHDYTVSFFFFFLVTLMIKNCLRPKHSEMVKTPCCFPTISLYLRSCTCSFTISHFLFKAYGKKH